MVETIDYPLAPEYKGTIDALDKIIAGEKRAWDKVAIPAVCFTDPEIVTAGQSHEQARKAG